MKDLRGVEIEVGNIVAFVTRRGNMHPLLTGKVVGFTTKMVKIKESNVDLEPTNIMPHNCCVIQQTKETIMKEL